MSDPTSRSQNGWPAEDDVIWSYIWLENWLDGREERPTPRFRHEPVDSDLAWLAVVAGPVPDLDLDAIEQRARLATPGPWFAETDSCDCGDGYGCGHGTWPSELRAPAKRTQHHPRLYPNQTNAAEIASFNDAHDATHEDADFIAHAREDVPVLVAEVRRLRTIVAEVMPVAR